MPARRQAPVLAVPRHHTYSSPRHDYGIDESLSRADFLSNAVLEDTYDAASRSRGKDKDLLRNVNSAIGAANTTAPWYLERAARARSVALEPPANARTARGASMPPAPARSTRGASTPPGAGRRPTQVPRLSLPPEPLPTAALRATSRRGRTPTAVLMARARSLERGGSLGPGDSYAQATSPRAQPAGAPATQHLVAHRPALLRKDAALASRARTDPRNPYSSPRLRRASSEPRGLDRGENSHHSYFYPSHPASYPYFYRVPGAGERALTKHVYAHRGRYGPDSKPPRPSLANFPQVYVPWNGPGPSNRAKAAIIGSKMEPEGRASKRGPRSQFAQNKMREIRREDIQRKYQ